MNWKAFVDQLAEWLEERSLIEPGGRWVLGVSGGPDSVLLLHAMHDLSQRRELDWTIHAAHLHHGIRGEAADADAELVARLAEQLGVRYHEERIDIPAQIARKGGSTEETARQRRYEFLERVALKTTSDCVGVGHHADDNAETILHRICRGTGLRGLAGMGDIRPIQPTSRVRLVRPLLGQRRKTIEALCAECGFETRTDESNASNEHTRSRIRNRVLPMLREALNPNVSEALLRLAEQARWLGMYLEDAAARTFDSMIISESPGQIVLNTHALLGKQRIIQAEVVRRAISLVLGRDQDLGFNHVEGVLRLAAGKASGKELHLPGPLLVRKQYDRLVFRPLTESEPPPELEPLFVRCPGTTPLPALSAELVVEVCEVDADRFEKVRHNLRPNEEWLDYERVRLPLLVRGRREGDRFSPLGAPGAKTLSDFFIDEKVEPQLRSRTGVLCDQEGPVWIIPLRIDERVKLRPTTRKALRLVLRPVQLRGARNA